MAFQWKDYSQQHNFYAKIFEIFYCVFEFYIGVVLGLVQKKISMFQFKILTFSALALAKKQVDQTSPKEPSNLRIAAHLMFFTFLHL